MNRKSITFLWVPFIFLALTGSLFLALADDDHKDRHRERKREHKSNGSDLKEVNNSVYREQCGGCHFAYQPDLLPSASWMNILDTLDDHFGEAVELDDDSKSTISDYLKSNGAEHSSAKRAVKIMRSSGNEIPLRITDTKYIREKHHDISSDILNRKSVGSLSNCTACHTTAENGNYDDDNVKIPK